LSLKLFAAQAVSLSVSLGGRKRRLNLGRRADRALESLLDFRDLSARVLGLGPCLGQLRLERASIAQLTFKLFAALPKRYRLGLRGFKRGRELGGRPRCCLKLAFEGVRAFLGAADVPLCFGQLRLKRSSILQLPLELFAAQAVGLSVSLGGRKRRLNLGRRANRALEPLFKVSDALLG
jgi:hypothetical protein